jgi:hypothetical protein
VWSFLPLWESGEDPLYHEISFLFFLYMSRIVYCLVLQHVTFLCQELEAFKLQHPMHTHDCKNSPTYIFPLSAIRNEHVSYANVTNFLFPQVLGFDDNSEPHFVRINFFTNQFASVLKNCKKSRLWSREAIWVHFNHVLINSNHSIVLLGIFFPLYKRDWAVCPCVFYIIVYYDYKLEMRTLY